MKLVALFCVLVCPFAFGGLGSCYLAARDISAVGHPLILPLNQREEVTTPITRLDDSTLGVIGTSERVAVLNLQTGTFEWQKQLNDSVWQVSASGNGLVTTVTTKAGSSLIYHDGSKFDIMLSNQNRVPAVPAGTVELSTDGTTAVAVPLKGETVNASVFRPWGRDDSRFLNYRPEEPGLFEGNAKMLKDDQQVVVTMMQHFSPWKGILAVHDLATKGTAQTPLTSGGMVLSMRPSIRVSRFSRAFAVTLTAEDKGEGRMVEQRTRIYQLPEGPVSSGTTLPHSHYFVTHDSAHARFPYAAQIEFTSDRRLLVGTKRGEVNIVDLDQPHSLPIERLFGGHLESAITRISSSTDGKVYATGSENGMVAIWVPDGSAKSYRVTGISQPIASLDFIEKNGHPTELIIGAWVPSRLTPMTMTRQYWRVFLGRH